MPLCPHCSLELRRSRSGSKRDGGAATSSSNSNWHDWLCCARRIRHSQAAMNGALCCCAPCKPRYRRLVDAIYPRSPNEGLINANMQKLTFYAISHPEKLERIGEYLVRRLARDLGRQRLVQVKIAVDAMDQLLQSCHSSPSLPQFSESHLRMVQKLLESCIPDLEQMATDSFVKFSNIEESSPSYHRQYDFFISKFSQMCHANGTSARKVRFAGLRGLRGVVWKSVTDDLHPNIWERQHMDKIVPSILYNMQDDEEPPMGAPQQLKQGEYGGGGANVDSLGHEFGKDTEADCPRELADQCLRELMGKATFGSLRAVLEPVLRHLDLHCKWQPPAAFSVLVFRAILYSIQTQNSYFVIQELINHLDTMASSDASVRIGIATVLSSIVSIAGTSIGPLLLSIFNSLLKHLRASVEFQQSQRCKAPDDEKTYQETLINAMGDFANALPDYQKVEIMMFTVGNIPKLSDEERKTREGDAFLQHVLVKTLLKVATKYRTAYLATVFTESFIGTLLQLALVRDRQVRLVTQKIFHTLLDRHDNLSRLQHLEYVLDVSELQLTIEKSSRADQMFMRKHVHNITQMIYRSVALVEEDDKMESQFDALLCTLSLLCIEVGHDETLIELFRLSFGLQSLALDAQQGFSPTKRAATHNLVARYLNLSCQLLAIPALYQHVHQVARARAQHGPPALNLLREEEDPLRTSAEEEKNEKETRTSPSLEMSEDEMLSLADELVFDRAVVADALKATGKDVSRLMAPFHTAGKLAAMASFTLEDGPLDLMDGSMLGDTLLNVTDGTGGNATHSDTGSVDSSLDWSPPSTRAHSRRGTIFSLANERTRFGLGQLAAPMNVNTLRTLVNTPIDPYEEERKEKAMAQEIVTAFRETPFDELCEEACHRKEDNDLSKMLQRCVEKHTEAVKLADLGRAPKPKSIFEITMPNSFVY